MSTVVQVRQLLSSEVLSAAADAAAVTSRNIAPVIKMLFSVKIVNKWHIGIKKPIVYERRVIPRHVMTLIIHLSLLNVRYIMFIVC